MKTEWANCAAPIIRHPIVELGEKDSVLQEDWTVEVNGFRFLVPAGTSTDGASIPRFLWRVCGHPLESPRLYAALLHDWIYGGCMLPPFSAAPRVHDAQYTGVPWIAVETLEGVEVDPYIITRAVADDCYYHLLRHFGISSFCAHVEWGAIRLFGGSHWSTDTHNPDEDDEEGSVPGDASPGSDDFG